MSEVIKSKIAPYIYFSSIYFISIGILYIWGYWSKFNINILRYISFTDALKLAAYPIVSTFIFIAIGAVIGEIISFGANLKPGEGADTKVGKLLNKYKNPLIGAYFFIVFYFLYFGDDKKWEFLPVLIALPIYVVARKRNLLSDLIVNDSQRSLIVFILVLLPVWAFGYGRLQAAYLIDGSKYTYVVDAKLEVVASAINHHRGHIVKYIGGVNEYMFFLMPDNKTVLIEKLGSEDWVKLRSK